MLIKIDYRGSYKQNIQIYPKILLYFRITVYLTNYKNEFISPKK